MKIAFFNLQPLDRNGGSETWIRKVCNIFNNNGDEVVIIIPSDKNRREIISGLEHIFFRSRMYSLLEKLGLKNLFSPFLDYKFSNEADVVYVPTIHPLFLFKSVLKQKKKLIIGAHDLFIPNKRIGIDIYQKISIIGISYLARKGKVIIHSLNPITSRALKGTGAVFFEIGNEFVTSDMSEPGQDNRDLFRNENEKYFTILFLGNIEQRKGSRLIPEIIEKLSNMDDILFIFAGKMKDTRLIKELNNLSDIAHFRGSVSEADKIDLLRNSDLFLFLSDREASPIVIEEAFSFGLPVVSTWKGVKELRSFRYSFCVISNRTIKEIVQSIIFIYSQWKNDAGKFYAEKSSRSRSYKEHLNYTKYKEEIINLFMS